jgi:hypothetical protein
LCSLVGNLTYIQTNRGYIVIMEALNQYELIAVN